MTPTEIFNIGDIFDQEGLANRGRLDVQRLEACLPDELLIKICEELIQKLARRIDAGKGLTFCLRSLSAACKLIQSINTLAPISSKVHAICTDIFFKQMHFTNVHMNGTPSGLPDISFSIVFRSWVLKHSIAQNLQMMVFQLRMIRDSKRFEGLLQFLRNAKAILPSIREIIIELRVQWKGFPTEYPAWVHNSNRENDVYDIVDALRGPPIERRIVGGAMDHDVAWTPGLEQVPRSSKSTAGLSTREIANAIVGDMERCRSHDFEYEDCESHTEYLIEDLDRATES